MRFALVVSVVLSAGLGPWVPAADAADTPQETVVPATLRTTNISATLLTNGAGAQGVFHKLEGAGLVWTRYADGRSVPAPAMAQDAYIPDGPHDDVLPYRHGDDRVDLWNPLDGTTRTLQIPQGQNFLSVAGATVVTFTTVTGADGTTAHTFHLLTADSTGVLRDVPVTGVPAAMNVYALRAADDTSLVFAAKQGGSYYMVAVDRETGRVQGWTQPLTVPYSQVGLSARHIVLSSASDPKVLVLPRSDISATPGELVLDGSGVNPAEGLSVVGDWAVYRPSAGTAVLAKPLSGGASLTVATADPTVSSTSYDTAVVKGRTTEDDWGIQRVTPGADGRPVVTQVKPLPRPPVPIQGLSLEQGRLIVTDTSSGRRDDYLRTVAATGTPEFGDRTSFTDWPVSIGACPVQDAGCSAVKGTADGRIAWVARGQGQDWVEVNGPGDYDLETHTVPAGGRITDVSGKYLIYTGGGLQYVYRLRDAVAPVTVPAGAGALWGDVLLTAGTTPGTITGFNLTTRTPAASLTIDAACVPTELQAVGRYLYWSCGPDGAAGVYDRTAGKSVPVPSGEARLGDGFVVTHDKAAGELTLTTVTNGQAVGRVIAELPDTGVSQRDVRWTVDEDGANAAYVDAQERVHLVPSGVPQQPLRLLAPARNAAAVAAAAPDVAPGSLTDLLLSKPSASWTLTVRDAKGAVVDTRQGGGSRGELDVTWHGTDPAHPGVGYFPEGRYTWSLSITPADGVGGPLIVTGAVELVEVPAWRDLVGLDGYGDLLGLDGTGRVYAYRGTGTGGLYPRQASTGSTFPTTARLVPFGDTNSDRCPDVLVRVGDELRAYRQGCDGNVSASSPYALIGKGWGQYDVLTSPGDLDGDGYMDLIARQTSTGDMYFYAGTATQVLHARVRIGTNWKLYTKIVGAGDLNGDGRGDLLGIDSSGGLWRYYGQSAGTITPRVKIASGWGTHYTAVVGMGDITGDGRTDIVARDTTGKLFRHSSTGTGTLAGPVMIGTAGWNTYKGLF